MTQLAVKQISKSHTTVLGQPYRGQSIAKIVVRVRERVCAMVFN